MPFCMAIDCMNSPLTGQEFCSEHWTTQDVIDKQAGGQPLHYRVAREAHETAGKLVQGDRRETHGDFIKNFEAIAHLWTGYLRAKFGADHPAITRTDVAALMSLMKKGRTMNGAYNPDDYVDDIGYAMINAGLAAVDAAKGKSE